MTEHLYEETKALREALKNSNTQRDQLKDMVRDLLNSRDAGCGCECHPPHACEWHGPIIKAKDMLARMS